MKANAKTQTEVMSVLDKFMESYRQRDLSGLLSTLAPDDDLFLFGTGADEKRIGREEFKYQAERDWAQTEALGFKFSNYHISAAGPVAWIAAEGVGQGEVAGQTIQFPLRMTAVLEQSNGKWYLAQSHISLPSASQEDGDSVPI